MEQIQIYIHKKIVKKKYIPEPKKGQCGVPGMHKRIEKLTFVDISRAHVNLVT